MGENRSSTQLFTIHPAMLDAAAQFRRLVPDKGRNCCYSVYCTKGIKGLWISASELGYPEPTVVRASSISRFKGSRGTECSMYTVNPGRILKNSISSIETTAMSSAPDATVQLSSPKTYALAWIESPSRPTWAPSKC